MERKIVITADGSSTIYLPDWNESYHSKHGAIQEAYHVFIKNGLHYLCPPELNSESPKNLSILEIGFGTGLNAFITLVEAERLSVDIDYVGVEAYPVLREETKNLNYASQIQVVHGDKLFGKLHEVSWENINQITQGFRLTKQQKFFTEIDDLETYQLIYFDAFGARVQPDLWTEAIFEKMYNALKPNGVLVTYSAKGSVRRAMQSVGFNVEKLPGPQGKREMLRATKHSAVPLNESF